MQNLLQADLSYFHNARLGVMTDNLAKHSWTAGSTISEAVDFVANLGMLSAYLIAAFLVSPFLAAGALGALFLVSVSMQHYVTLGKTKGIVMVGRDNEMQVSALESLSGIHVVKSFLLERLRWLDFNHKVVQVGEIQFELNRDRNRMVVIQELSISL